MGDMYQNVNIYDNFLVIFGKNFISPIADGGKGYYDYYLTDSAFVGKYWCYKLDLHPQARAGTGFQAGRCGSAIPPTPCTGSKRASPQAPTSTSCRASG
jgi:hypothetical protein